MDLPYSAAPNGEPMNNYRPSHKRRKNYSLSWSDFPGIANRSPNKISESCQSSHDHHKTLPGIASVFPDIADLERENPPVSSPFGSNHYTPLLPFDSVFSGLGNDDQLRPWPVSAAAGLLPAVDRSCIDPSLIEPFDTSDSGYGTSFGGTFAPTSYPSHSIGQSWGYHSWNGSSESTDSAYGSFFSGASAQSPHVGHSSSAGVHGDWASLKLIDPSESADSGYGTSFSRTSSKQSHITYSSSADSTYGTLSNRSSNDDESSKGLCSIATCGRMVKNLKAHMLTHQNERPEKCPIPTCEYHIKGFARKYDRKRHTLTHYKGVLVCAFCPGGGTAAERTFNRADVFKRHLTSVHGVEQTPPNARRPKKEPGRSPLVPNSSASSGRSGQCCTCENAFADAQDFYEHLDDCVLRVIVEGHTGRTIPGIKYNAGVLDHNKENLPSSVSDNARSPRVNSGYNRVGLKQLERHDGFNAERIVPVDDDVESIGPNPRHQRRSKSIMSSPARTQNTPTGPAVWSSHRLEELREIVADLQSRTESLLRQTSLLSRPGRGATTQRSSRERSRRSHSTPPPFGLARRSLTPAGSDISQEQPDLDQTPDAESEYSSFSSTPCQSIRSDAGASYNQSRRSVLQSSRASSEPPIRRRAIDSTRNHATGSSTVNSSTSNSQSGFDQSTRKRKSPQDSNQNGDEHERGAKDPASKRRKLSGPGDGPTDKERFPCIFHVGEPRRYATDDKKYEYISQLLRHLQRHDFYACRKCFTKFVDSEAQELHHQETPCIKSCRGKRCLRYLPAGSTRPGTCDHVDSPESQWRELFLLQYPNSAVPGLIPWQDYDDTEAAAAAPNLSNSISRQSDSTVPRSQALDTNTAISSVHASDETIQHSIEGLDALGNGTNIDGLWNVSSTMLADFQAPGINMVELSFPPSGDTVRNFDEPGANMTDHMLGPEPQAQQIQVDENFFSDVQALRQRVQLLEQRLAQPTDRESDLEMVLGNVWQALARTGSAEAQPESPVWRLVRRFAGGILSSVPRGLQEGLATTGIPPAPPQETIAPALDMRDLLGTTMPAVSKSRFGADSGYQSFF